MTGGLAWIDRAFEWAKKYGIGVLLDMHAAPGSQNGFDNSSPSTPEEKDWDKSSSNVGQTVDSMQLYAQRYGTHEALVGFGLLNEPRGIDIGILQDYYKRAYAAVRKHSANSWVVINPLIFPDESGAEPHWTGFMNTNQGFSRVAMDLHFYSCMGGPSDLSDADGVIGYTKRDRKNAIEHYMKVNPKPVLIGEWSACMHSDQNRLADFMRAEVQVFNEANLGWTFWSWTEATGEAWSLKTAFNKEWIKNLPTAC